MKPWELQTLLAYIEYIRFRPSWRWGERQTTECISWPPSPQQIMDAYANVRKLWDLVPDGNVNSL